MSARFGIRAFRAQMPKVNNNMRFAQRRTYQSAAENPNNIEAPPAGKLAQLWNSPVGPKTVHFWAPIMKWGLVLAGAADFARPADQLSLSQNAALTATGLIWTRWCFIIKPRNLFLASVNFLLFCVGATQTTRVLMYNASQKNESPIEAAKQEVSKDVGAVEKIVETPKAAVKSVTNPK
ncbi:hypothetical protein Q7P37_011258 [Cladosporium fusiforme]